MFRDGRQIPEGSTLTTDLCVIGGGAAGITIALGVRDAGFSTMLLEAGGFDADETTQAVYRGTVDSNVLPAGYLHTSRLRRFGGTTNHWGGHSVVINANVFRPRAGVADGAWPFDAAVLRPYYARAAEVLRKPRPVAASWDPTPEADLVPMERYGGTSEDDRRLGPAYRAELERSAIDIILNGTVTALRTASTGRRVEAVTVRTLAGTGFTVRARAVVLATGAIENARLLLLPAAGHRDGIGNDHDVAGRYFADHLFRTDQVVETSPIWTTRVGPFFTFTPELQEAHAIPEIGVMRRAAADAPGRASADTPILTLAGVVDGTPGGIGHVTYYIEPLPEPENRVVLSDEMDPFGQPRSTVRFVVSPALAERFASAVTLLATLAGRHGLGRVRYQERDRFGFGSHHMFTTRMSADPRRGVVDADSRVHGVANLFVAGSSVFPSSGCGNPTFPLIAMAARLTDHVRDGLERRAFA